MSHADVDDKLHYHNWMHVSHVLNSLRDLLADQDFSPEHKEDLILAAIWHDADYAHGADGHEERSADLAIASLAQEGLSEERLERIKRLILSTQMTYEPKALDEQFIKDADLAHLGGKEYMKFYNGLYEEIKALYEPDLTRRSGETNV